MSLREDWIRSRPDFPWLQVDDLAGLRAYLGRAHWLKPGEEVRDCEHAGDGNMNLTLRVRTDRRSFILKQARPWVEKYPDIAAPWERSRFEQRFYARVAGIPGVASRMPELLGRDPEARVLLLEDLPDAQDLSPLYAEAGRAQIADAEIDELAAYLRALHDATDGPPDPELANRDMRALNHSHIYEIPLGPEAPVDLDALEPGLARTADELRADAAYRRAVAETGERYLQDGPCLLHGDYFPGSWLRSRHGLRVIDPEFGFCGDPEFDVGCAAAHLALAGQEPERALRFLESYGRALEPRWVARFAATEVMRRLIGVAQLPIPPSDGFRAELLDRSRRAMIRERLEELWK
ncbi:MAG: phosphotransferase [Proteobacteria bacterium]|nr:phosphotransferase [Pseudomonadota bacterium]